MFNGEFDLLEIRLNILNDYVDEFIIVEAPTTFSGLPKPLYYEENKLRYAKWAHKIKYFVINENYSKAEIAFAESSPNTQGAAHWKHEFLQKESIHKALLHLGDEDIVFIGDCDEIWDLEYFQDDTKDLIQDVSKLSLRVYTYWLNNSSSEQFWGTIVGKYKSIKNECLNHLRTNARKVYGYWGWHFTSLKDGLKRKLLDSYTEETYNNKWVQEHLDENIAQNKDFLGRNFTYTVDESHWPQYLKDNKEKYAHLCR